MIRPQRLTDGAATISIDVRAQYPQIANADADAEAQADAAAIATARLLCQQIRLQRAAAIRAHANLDWLTVHSLLQ